MLVGSLGSRLVDVGLRWDALLLCACVRASCVWICVSGCFGSLLEVEEKKSRSGLRATAASVGG